MTKTVNIPRHPAKYTDALIPYFYEEVKNCSNILDPFAGTGKIATIKDLGYNGTIYANDIERDWLEPNIYGCDYITFQDSEYLDYEEGFFDAIVTSPTYGNRMADHHKAKDGSRRITYTHCLGKELQSGNTGQMHFGEKYCDKHKKIYAHLFKLLKPEGKLVLNISNFIRRGEEVDVTKWTLETLQDVGFVLVDIIKVNTPRMRFGSNANKRVEYESILIMKKAS